MKKFLILIILCLSINITAIANDNSQIPDQDTKQELLTQWLKSHPDKAKELKEILPKAQDPTSALDQWLESNPDSAQQLQNLIMPEGDGQ